ncbi:MULTISPECIES: DUF2318 domain-containing protein [Desulfosediminicola]|uniref:DUF2318 domain-containing protein n=1 Tax=Desulfosediminicola TaxID=2886823 RepID=UPI0010AB6216|nr:DUF2318 domain-containing protein [Desulfosediminicola ganghwensis]
MQKTRSIIFTGAIVIACLLLAFSSHAFFNVFGGSGKVTAVGGEVILSLAEVSDGKAHHFSYEHDKTEIKFFVMKSPDGVMHAAFDACDVCYPAKKGYSQDGDFMVCNNCGMRFHSSRINHEQGGCNPAPLNHAVKGKDLVIKVADLLPGARFF